MWPDAGCERPWRCRLALEAADHDEQADQQQVQQRHGPEQAEQRRHQDQSASPYDRIHEAREQRGEGQHQNVHGLPTIIKNK